MIAFKTGKYDGSERSYPEEYSHILKEIEELVKTDSYFAYSKAYKYSDQLIDIGAKKQKAVESDSFNQKDIDKFLLLKNRIPWDIKKPYTEFESLAATVLQEIEVLLIEKKQNSIIEYNEKILEADCLIENYIKKSRLTDPDIRLKFHDRINEVKEVINSGSLTAYILRSGEAIEEIEKLRLENDDKYSNVYLPALKKYEVSRSFFNKYKDYVRPKDIKNVQDQYILIEKLLQSCKYDLMCKAVEMINRLDAKITEMVKEKKKNICESLRLQIEKLRPAIWMEDWDVLNKNVSQMIKDAEETGSLLNLNLDRYHIDPKIYEKKDEILKLISALQSKRINNYSAVLSRAEKFINEASYKNDFNEFKRQFGTGTGPVGTTDGKTDSSAERNKVTGFINSIFRKKD